MTGISEESNWVTLEKRKHDKGHTLLYSVLKGKAATLTNHLLPKDRENRNNQFLAFQIPYDSSTDSNSA